MANNPRGRPAGGSDARDRIVTAARESFLSEGFARTSVRSIARKAGVDHSLVNYHFGGKEALFGEVMGVIGNPAGLMADVFAATPPERLPGAVLRQVLAMWESDSEGGSLREVMREAARTPSLAGLVEDYLEKTLIAWFEEAIPGRYAHQRATACAMVLAGLVLGRYVFEMPSFVALTREEVERFYGPVLEAAFRGPSVRGAGQWRA